MNCLVLVPACAEALQVVTSSLSGSLHLHSRIVRSVGPPQVARAALDLCMHVAP